MKILQFGSGVFLRGFFDWMIEEVKEQKLAEPEVTLVKLTSHGDLSTYEKQQGEFHVVLRGLQHGETVNKLQRITCLKNFIHPYNQWEHFLESAKDETYQLVLSNSTEAGLCFEGTTGFDECPDSFPAKLYAWLVARFKHFNGAPTAGVQIMACELVPDNADKLKAILLKHAKQHQQGSEFTEWLLKSCIFINTLVDRIVSKISDEDSAALQTEWNVNDSLMLCAEPYHLLAIDSPELEKILPLQKAGLNIIVTDNLDAVRERKVKVLNGAHMFLVPAGLLSGLSIVEETLQHQQLRAFTETGLREEVALTIDDKDIEEYINSVIERFENPFLNHRLVNISLNSAAKIGQRLFPSIHDYFKLTGQMPERLIKAVALFLEFYKGEMIKPGTLKTSWGILQDSPEAVNFLNSLKKSSGAETAAAISSQQFWPVDPAMKDAFNDALGAAIDHLASVGIRNFL